MVSHQHCNSLRHPISKRNKMKTFRNTILTILASALALNGCGKFDGTSGNNSGNIDDNGTVRTQMSIALVPDTGDELPKPVWGKSDKANLFHQNAGDFVSDRIFNFDQRDIFSGSVTGETGEEPIVWYALYPGSLVNKNPQGDNSVSIASGRQTQEGYDSIDHICGENYPLYGSAQAPFANVSIKLKPLYSVVRLNVKNASGKAQIIKSASITADKNICGFFSVDFSSSSIAYGELSASATATTDVLSPTELAPGSSAAVFIGTAPFSGKIKCKVNSEIGEKEYEIALKAGEVISLDIEYTGNDSPDPEPEPEPEPDDPLLSDELPGTFSVDASGRKVKFSRGNLWFGYEDSENKFKIEEKQNYSYPNENSDSGCELNKTHVSHFLWSTTAEEAYGDSRTSTDFAPEDRLFAVDGGAIEGWTVLTKAEWDYLLNEREVNGGKGNGYSYFNCCKAKNYYIDGAIVRGLLIFPDDYSGDRFNSGSNKDKSITWEEIDKAGIAYLPANGSSNRNYDTGWISGTKFNGYYMCSDISGTDDSKAPYAIIRFKDSVDPESFYLSSKATAVGIRLVKPVPKSE